MSQRPNWIEIKKAYQKGEGSCRELASKFNTTPSSIQGKCKRDGWKKEMDKAEQEIAQNVVKEVIKQEVGLLTHVLQGLTRDFKAIENSLEQGADLLEPVDVKHLVSARKMVIDSYLELGALARAAQKVEHSGSIQLTKEQEEHMLTLQGQLEARNKSVEVKDPLLAMCSHDQ